MEVSIDDVIAANGRRSPAYPDTPRDLDVVGVGRQPDQVDDDLAAEFDQAIESCALGYDTASGNLSRLVATTPFRRAPRRGPRDAGPADTGAPTPQLPMPGPPTPATSPWSTTPPPRPWPLAPRVAAPAPPPRPPPGPPPRPSAALGLALALVRRRRRASGARVVVPSVA